VAAQMPVDQPLSAKRVDELYAWSQGRAAGLTVMLRRESRPAAMTDNAERDPRQATFNLLSSQVFGRLTTTVQQFLLDTACLDHIAVPVAERITGNEDSRLILDSLVSENSFTTYWTRRDGADFRQQPRKTFLLALAAARLRGDHVRFQSGHADSEHRGVSYRRRRVLHPDQRHYIEGRAVHGRGGGIGGPIGFS
jgi:ATP/maltotriose-dependent transcriptional regulator MalT